MFRTHKRDIVYRHLGGLESHHSESYEIELEDASEGTDPCIRLRVSEFNGDELSRSGLTLTSGDARSLAAQLIRAADLLDFDEVLAITVTDLEPSVRWYEAVFDVHPVQDAPHPGGVGRILTGDELAERVGGPLQQSFLANDGHRVSVRRTGRAAHPGGQPTPR